MGNGAQRPAAVPRGYLPPRRAWGRAPMNVVEKILANASGRKHVSPGDVVVAQVDLMVMHDISSNMVMKVLETEMENATVHDPSRIVLVFDHNFSPATQLAAETLAAVRNFAARLASVMSSTPEAAVCIMP